MQPDPAVTRKQLDLIRVVALVDFLLLVALVASSLSDNESGVSVLGPIHGVIFLGLLYLVVRGAGEGRWGWWFALTTPIPIFALAGERKVRKDLEAATWPT